MLVFFFFPKQIKSLFYSKMKFIWSLLLAPIFKVINCWWLCVSRGPQKSFAGGFVSSLWGFSFSVVRYITSDVLLFCFSNTAFRVTSVKIKGLKPLWFFLKQHLLQFIALTAIAHFQKETKPDQEQTWQSHCLSVPSFNFCESEPC